MHSINPLATIQTSDSMLREFARSNRRNLANIALSTTVVPLVLAGCSTTKEGVEVAASNGGSEKTVTYEIQGESKRAFTSYVEGEGKVKELNDLKTPWKQEAKIAPFSLAQITALTINPNEKITCRILFEGKEVGTKEKLDRGETCKAEATEPK